MKDNDDRTTPSWAVEEGDDAIVMLIELGSCRKSKRVRHEAIECCMPAVESTFLLPTEGDVTRASALFFIHPVNILLIITTIHCPSLPIIAHLHQHLSLPTTMALNILCTIDILPSLYPPSDGFRLAYDVICFRTMTALSPK